MTVPSGARRWWIYQRERFPLLLNGVLVAAMVLVSLDHAARLHGRAGSSAVAAAAAVVSCLLFFVQLRVADEFKDHDDDRAHRPYRPVPRGLVTLRELAWIAAGAALLQLALALAFGGALLLPLLAVWLWMALMAREFFAPAWLQAHPPLYLLSHMVVLPLIVLYASAFDWRLAGEALPAWGLGWLLAFGFLTGVVLEVGRKLRAPVDEESGVETYSALYGVRGALVLWLVALLLAGGAGLAAALQVGSPWPLASLLLATLIVAVAASRGPLRRVAASGRRFELLSGIWTLTAYLAIGLAPLLSPGWGGG